MANSPAIVWFRNDLRLTDHPALISAHQSKRPLLCVFIYEPREHGLWKLGEGNTFWLYHSLKSLQEEIQSLGGKLIIREGDAASILMEIVQETAAEKIYWNHLYEPALIKRDAKIKALLEAADVEVNTFHGNLLFEPRKILALHGKPYRVFSAFKKCALKFLAVEPPLENLEGAEFFRGKIDSLSIAKTSLFPLSKQAKGWEKYWHPGTKEAHRKLEFFVKTKLNSYKKERGLPCEQGTSLLSPHLHFGEVSPREVWHKVKKCEAFQNEMIWREFAHHMLLAFPHTPLQPFREEFKKFPWAKDAKWLKFWTEGKTGYPYIDAGMRQLLQTGWMHNRVRMAVASFLVKDLLIPWQEGAKWFWEILVDADLANNTLNWQWCAGTGVDAAAFVRIFHPVEQGKKFDPEGKYIKEFLPELKNLPTKYIHHPWKAPKEILEKANIELGKDYPYPICDHRQARELALNAFQQIVKKKKEIEDKHEIAS